jgi:hypothetical protein
LFALLLVANVNILAIDSETVQTIIHMNKPKCKFGIVLAIVGFGVMLAGVIPGVIHLVSGSYRDIYTIPIVLGPADGTHQKIRFHTRGRMDFSFWLKVPNRSIENKKFEFKVALIDSAGRRHAKFGENFRFGYMRSSTEGGQYYRLGRYRAENEFAGYLQYQSHGKWKPAYDGAIVLRRRDDARMPVKSIYVSALGLFGLLLGIGSILKHRRLPKACPESVDPVRSALLRCKLLKNQDSIPN